LWACIITVFFSGHVFYDIILFYFPSWAILAGDWPGTNDVLLSPVDKWDIAGIARRDIAQRSLLVRISESGVFVFIKLGYSI
jgi:hypothetical protein